jgi:transposase
MYLRHSKVKKNGKTHTYWRLVKSERVGGKVRQVTVAQLGELDSQGRAKASALAKHFLGPRARQRDLFEDTSEVGPLKIKGDKVRVERARAFGDVWLAYKLWQVLRLDEFCESVIEPGKEDLPWSQIAAILVVARFCEPSSELHIAEDWYRRTALEDILGVHPEQVHHSRLYRGLDRLLPYKAELEAHLKECYGHLFASDFDFMIYDVTSTYFEGEAKRNPMAQRGYSRDHRADCKQVCIGLVVTRQGFPVGYEVFDGNRTDVTTVEEVVEAMEARHGKARRIWVMDRGMTSEENLQWLRDGGRQYVVGTPRSELHKWEIELKEEAGWEQVRDGLEVKICEWPFDNDARSNEVFVLCRSADRQRKEQAIHESFSRRIVDGLESLRRRLKNSKQRANRVQVERQIGRLLGRNSRAAAKFKVDVEEDPSCPSGLRLTWRTNRKWQDWAMLTEGSYILRSNTVDWTPEELWHTYMQLQEAEAAFRIQKSQLRIRPIWHQREDRVLAHILVCFLAYAMWKTLSGWQQRAHLGSSPRTILEELARIQTVDVILPLDNGRDMRLRCVMKPEPATQALLDRLGLRLPHRLRAPEVDLEM